VGGGRKAIAGDVRATPPRGMSSTDDFRGVGESRLGVANLSAVVPPTPRDWDATAEADLLRKSAQRVEPDVAGAGRLTEGARVDGSIGSRYTTSFVRRRISPFLGEGRAS